MYRNSLEGLVCILKCFLQLNMFQELQIFCICLYLFGCRFSLFRLCGSDFGITPVDDITNGITWAVFCFHIAHISFASSWYLFCLSVIVLAILCVFGTAMSIKKVFFVFLLMNVISGRLKLLYYYYYYYYYYYKTKFITVLCLSDNDYFSQLFLNCCKDQINKTTTFLWQYLSVLERHTTFNIRFRYSYYMPIPVAVCCKAWVCGRSTAGIAGSNPAGGMDVCIFWIFGVVR